MDTRTQRIIHMVKQAQQDFAADNLMITIPGYAAKKFVAYCSMKEDLELLKNYVALLKSKPDKTIASALTYALIAIYGKCFTDASQNSNPKLEVSEIPEENGFKETHLYLMDLRHQFVAHRGDTDSEIGISFMLVPKRGELKEKTELRFSQMKMVSFPKEDLERVDQLLDFLIKILVEKIQKAGQKLHSHMLTEFTSEQLNLMRMDNAK